MELATSATGSDGMALVSRSFRSFGMLHLEPCIPEQADQDPGRSMGAARQTRPAPAMQMSVAMMFR